MTEQAPPEATEAALALVTRMAGYNGSDAPDRVLWPAVGEARRIAALLPKPVDEAVLVCREIVASFSQPKSYITFSAGRDSARLILDGVCDDGSAMLLALSAYRAGAASTRGRGA